MDYIRKYWHIIAGVVCVIILGGVYFWRDGGGLHITGAEAVYDYAAGRSVLIHPSDNIEAAAAVEPEITDIVVHIEGAVREPGVFTLPYGSRVNDLLTLAGGATDEADLRRVNLAAFLADAQQVIIPAEGEEIYIAESSATASSAEPGIGSGGLININTADERLLTTLSGIGPVLSGNIIAHREANGPFNSIEDLRNVSGIGAGRLNNIRDHITVD